MDEVNIVEPGQFFQRCHIDWTYYVGQLVFQCFYDTEEFLKDQYLLIVRALDHLDIFSVAWSGMF